MNSPPQEAGSTKGQTLPTPFERRACHSGDDIGKKLIFKPCDLVLQT
jgi:hypothetical protein